MGDGAESISIPWLLAGTSGRGPGLAGGVRVIWTSSSSSSEESELKIRAVVEVIRASRWYSVAMRRCVSALRVGVYGVCGREKEACGSV